MLLHILIADLIHLIIIKSLNQTDTAFDKLTHSSIKDLFTDGFSNVIVAKSAGQPSVEEKRISDSVRWLLLASGSQLFLTKYSVTTLLT